MTVDKVLKWITEDGSVKGVSVCDAGMQSCLEYLHTWHRKSVLASFTNAHCQVQDSYSGVWLHSHISQ